MQKSGSVFLEVFRFTPEEGEDGKFQRFEVECAQPLSVMALLAEVRLLDPTFACRSSLCYKGKCGSCLVRVNGQDVFGCVTLVKPGETIRVEPHSKFKLLRDVVVDFSAPR